MDILLCKPIQRTSSIRGASTPQAKGFGVAIPIAALRQNNASQAPPFRVHHSGVLRGTTVMSAASETATPAPPANDNKGKANGNAAPVPPASEENALNLTIAFDNDTDEEATILNISGQDQSDLLMQLTGALSALELHVLAATIKTTDDGQVLDVFRVVDNKGNKVPETRFDSIKNQILSFAASSSRSGKPAIYGIAATAELQRIKPLSEDSNLENDALQLELAAAEMAEAAALLVAIERDLASMAATASSEPLVMSTKEAARAEAAAQLERRMAAMQAVLASRRSSAQPVVAPPPAMEPTLEIGAGAEILIQGFAAVSAALARPVSRVWPWSRDRAASPEPTTHFDGTQTGAPTSTGPAAGNGYEVLLQGFNWESCNHGDWYQVLIEHAPLYAETGFTGLWLPPPTDSVSPQGYLPRDLYLLDSQFGSEASLRECISVLHDYNFKVIADIVINHRCAHKQDDRGRWNVFGGRLAWDHTFVCSNNPQFGGAGSYKREDDYAAAPNIDHSKEQVREDLKKWLKWLRNSIGFDGWRFDYVKGYDGKWTKEYIDASVPLMAFGEFWDCCDYTDGVLNYNQDGHRQRTVDWCDTTGGTAAAFDFTTKGVLQEAVLRHEYWRLVDPKGRPPGMIGLWPSRAITFIENHDTGSTLRHWPFPYQNTLEGYAYILTHPGTPCVFYDHFHDPNFKVAMVEMIKTRKRNAINARSKVTVRKAYADVYAATVDDRVAVKIGPGDWSPNTGDTAVGGKRWKLTASGFQFAVWELENP